MVRVTPHPRTQCCASKPAGPPWVTEKKIKVNIETGVWGYGKSTHAVSTKTCDKFIGVSRAKIQVFFHEGCSCRDACCAENREVLNVCCIRSLT
jgi:hypothetical protein